MVDWRVGESGARCAVLFSTLWCEMITPLAHRRNGGQTQDRIGLGLMTSACLWFHGKLSGGNRRGKELLSLCTQGKKNPVGPHVRRGWRVVACVRGKSKE